MTTPDDKRLQDQVNAARSGNWRDEDNAPGDQWRNEQRGLPPNAPSGWEKHTPLLQADATATCCCSRAKADCPYHGEHPTAHDTYAEHCREHLPGTPAHGGGRCDLCDLTPPDTRSEVETLTPSQRARFMEAADAALRVRRAVLLLAEHATGHRKQVHGDRCEDCGLDYPCVTVKWAAGPVFEAVGDLPSQRPARHDADREDGVWFSPSDLVRHDADLAAAKAAGAAEVIARVAALASEWEQGDMGYPARSWEFVKDLRDLRAALTTGGEG